MLSEQHEFPATSNPLDSYLEHCTHSRPAYQFLSEHLGELGDEFSRVLLWHTADDEKRYAWCYLQRIHSTFVLRVVHLEGQTEAALTAAEALYANPCEAVLDQALDVLDDAGEVPAQARGDIVRFVKDSCDAQLFEVTIAELNVADISELQAKTVMLSELRAYCSALGA